MPFKQTLAKLGFSSYRAYLRSDLWADIRRRVFATKGRICVGCGGKANSVHHRSYDVGTMSGARLRSLDPICGACHAEIEFTNKGRKKNSLSQANKKLNRKKRAKKKTDHAANDQYLKWLEGGVESK